MVIEIGAGLAVPTVRYAGERAANRAQTTFIRVNPRECEVVPCVFKTMSLTLSSYVLH